MLGFVAFHIRSRPWRPQKIKEKWKDTQPLLPGTLADPNEPGVWVGAGGHRRDRKGLWDWGMGDAPARSTQATGRDGFDSRAPEPPSASADHRWAPQGSLGLVAQWLRKAVLIGQSEHHHLRCTLRTVYGGLCWGGTVTGRAAISQSLLITHPGGAI